MPSKAELKRVGALSGKKQRTAQKMFIVEGLRAVQEAAASGFVVHMTYYAAAFLGTEEGRLLIAELRHKNIKAQETPARQMASMSETVHAQGIVAVVEQKTADVKDILHPSGASPLLVALDGVSDPGNLGGMIRTCDWFGVDGVILGSGCVDLFNPKVVRSTMGSIFHVPIAVNVAMVPCIDEARRQGFLVVATDSRGGETSQSIGSNLRLLVVLGNEAHGVDPDILSRADRTVAIPRYGQAESLNVGVACGIVLSSLRPART